MAKGSQPLIDSTIISQSARICRNAVLETTFPGFAQRFVESESGPQIHVVIDHPQIMANNVDDFAKRLVDNRSRPV